MAAGESPELFVVVIRGVVYELAGVLVKTTPHPRRLHYAHRFWTDISGPLALRTTIRSHHNKAITPMRKSTKQSSDKHVLALVRRELAREEEPKHYDVLSSGTAGIAGSGVLYLSSMAQGITDITRVGDRISLKHIEARWDLIFADATNFMRFILFQWVGDAVSDVPAISSVLESTPYYLSPFNWDQRHKFRILHDETYRLDATASPRTHIGRCKVGLSKSHIQFLNASTNIEAGGLFALFMSDSAAAAHPAYDLYTRIAYTDG